MAVENYNPIVDRISETMVRVAYNPTRCQMTREDWIGLHARLSRESGEAVFLDLGNMPRGVIAINHNPTRIDDGADMEYAIQEVLKVIKEKSYSFDDYLLASD